MEAGIVKWPMSVLRLRSEDDGRLVELADKILTAWRSYTDKDAFIFAETDGEPHNTITPIARIKGEMARLGKVLVSGGDPAADPELVKHAEWAARLREKHSFTAENMEEILRQEIGLVFARVLDHAGVFKCMPAGRDAFLRFVGAVR